MESDSWGDDLHVLFPVRRERRSPPWIRNRALERSGCLSIPLDSSIFPLRSWNYIRSCHWQNGFSTCCVMALYAKGHHPLPWMFQSAEVAQATPAGVLYSGIVFRRVVGYLSTLNNVYYIQSYPYLFPVMFSFLLTSCFTSGGPTCRHYQ